MRTGKRWCPIGPARYRASWSPSRSGTGYGLERQFADVSGRHEPGTGEIGWEYVFRRIDELGYAGWICCEYAPLGDTAEGLAWRKRYGV